MWGSRRPGPILVAAVIVVAVIVVAGLAILATGSPSVRAQGPDETVSAAVPLEPGTLATVVDDGSCLRLRETPGLDGAILTCLSPGSVVVVRAGTVDADGFRWQAVRTEAGREGWVADAFLRPVVTPAACDAARSPVAIPPGLTRPLPSAGGGTYLYWGGGTVAGLLTEAQWRGCDVAAVWAWIPERAAFVGYHPGAPEVVNGAWRSQFPEGRMPVGTILYVICAGPLDAGRTRVPAPPGAVPPPLPWAAAPARFEGPAPPDVSAVAAIVVDETSGATLYAKEAHEPLPPASLTKIATAIVAIEGSDLDRWVLVDVDGRRMRGQSLMGLRPGDCFQVRDLLGGLLLESGNDAALALGRAISGSDAAFVELLNLRLGRLGLEESHFSDAHGLGGPMHRASAYDLAMLSRYAMQLPLFAETVAQTTGEASGSRVITLRNGNRLLERYEGADGVKTGFTDEAGRTLVGSARRDGHRIYVVLLDADARYGDAERLLDWAFAAYRW